MRLRLLKAEPCHREGEDEVIGAAMELGVNDALRFILGSGVSRLAEETVVPPAVDGMT